MKTSPRRAVGLASLGLVMGLLLGWQVLHRRPVATPAPTDHPAQAMEVTSVPLAESSFQSTPKTEPIFGPIKAIPAAETAEQLSNQIEAALRTGTLAEWERVLNQLFPALLAKDRKAAARLAEKLKDGERREQLLRKVARAWAAVDLSEAVTWSASLPNPEDRKAALEDACFQVAETDPAEAIHTWEALDFTADDHTLENLAQQWAEKNLDAARAWVEAKPPSKFRDQAVARVAYVLAQQKPAEALVFISRELPAGPAQTEAAISALHQWAQHDLPAAKKWVQQLPGSELAERARNELVGLSGRQKTSSRPF